MDFIDQLKQFSNRVRSLKDTITNEEATKTAIIMPFFAMLGYDVFNPEEFMPEFTADVGIKKGEKVDYAIMQNGGPVILIETKWIGTALEKHDSQLFRYFGTTTAKFGILTNGLIYKFYTDLDAPNRMDLQPFLELDILDIKEAQVNELKKFHKSNFDLENMINAASDLRYSNAFRSFFLDQLQNPGDELVRLFLSESYSGMKTQTVVERFRPLLKKSLNLCISEMMNDKIKAALGSDDDIPAAEESSPDAAAEHEDTEPESRVITTHQELEAYFIVKSMLRDYAPLPDITYKDTESYLAILYQDSSWKWICRLVLTDSKNVLIYPDEHKKSIRVPIENVYELENYKEQLVEVLKRYL
jgi:Uncharacterized conserved protein